MSEDDSPILPRERGTYLVYAILTLILLAFALFGLFWGGSLMIQSYLYSAPTEKLPIRAAVSCAVMSLFFTLWILLDQRSPGTYGTLFDFDTDEVVNYTEFDAIQLDRAGEERAVTYKRRIGGRRASDYLSEASKPFVHFSSDAIVKAIVIREEDGTEVRFETPIREEEGRSGPGKFYRFDKEASGDKVIYTEVDGSRYIDADSAGKVHHPRTSVLLANLLINLVHFLLWWGVFWVGLRYQLWHALGFALAMWGLFILAIVPILLTLNK